MLKPGWAKRQIVNTARNISQWPTWMRREAGLKDIAEPPDSYWFPLDKWGYRIENNILFVAKTWKYYKETHPEHRDEPLPK